MKKTEMIAALQEQNRTFLDNQEAEHFCPRCGRKKLNEHVAANRISKHVKGVYVCSDCLLDERFRKEFVLEKLDIADWHYFKED